MQHYRLLRNNKEAGPFTWKELVDLPLKPYDLIWVDGKSAAWRYPSELPEFKSVAPAVEDDFYQRFHTPQSASGPVEHTALPLEENPRKKSISVILPDLGSEPGTVRRSTAPIREPVLRVIVKPQTKTDGKDGQSRPEDEGNDVQTRQRDEGNDGQSSQGDEGISGQFIQENKEDGNQEARRIDTGSNSTTNRNTPKSRLVIIAAAATVLIFFAIKWLVGSSASQVASHSDQNDELPVVHTALADIEEQEEDLPRLPSNPTLEFAALKRHLSIQPNLINVGMFGGISRLSLGIRNTHSQPIDSIRIAIDFLGKDQSLDHTEFILVPRVEANSEITVKVPANGNGRAVQTRILSIGKYSN